MRCDKCVYAIKSVIWVFIFTDSVADLGVESKVNNKRFPVLKMSQSSETN